MATVISRMSPAKSVGRSAAATSPLLTLPKVSDMDLADGGRGNRLGIEVVKDLDRPGRIHRLKILSTVQSRMVMHEQAEQRITIGKWQDICSDEHLAEFAECPPRSDSIRNRSGFR
jgi:hypothetical protein